MPSKFGWHSATLGDTRMDQRINREGSLASSERGNVTTSRRAVSFGDMNSGFQGAKTPVVQKKRRMPKWHRVTCSDGIFLSELA
ncbi:predicted hydroxylase [Pseudozyma hubeiensis SY62]|uniref:Predicted hydroxylase n=1 Tax=Pseudozyma hubeiensis (strain SY62) TaxID=1305764 RepID=R9P960_PSEHS|nr:predicted hydroxylase [Pseudozyma hubeiensis SY62]GAC97787.1 predicted hydroxylase [Pseudozyma hubeiensis SY62]